MIWYLSNLGRVKYIFCILSYSNLFSKVLKLKSSLRSCHPNLSPLSVSLKKWSNSVGPLVTSRGGRTQSICGITRVKCFLINFMDEFRWRTIKSRSGKSRCNTIFFYATVNSERDPIIIVLLTLSNCISNFWVRVFNLKILNFETIK